MTTRLSPEHPASQLGRLALRGDGCVMLGLRATYQRRPQDREVARFVTLTQTEALDAVDRAPTSALAMPLQEPRGRSRALAKGYPEPTGAP